MRLPLIAESPKISENNAENNENNIKKAGSAGLEPTLYR